MRPVVHRPLRLWYASQPVAPARPGSARWELCSQSFAAGKSTVAYTLEHALVSEGKNAFVLDGAARLSAWFPPPSFAAAAGAAADIHLGCGARLQLRATPTGVRHGRRQHPSRAEQELGVFACRSHRKHSSHWRDPNSSPALPCAASESASLPAGEVGKLFSDAGTIALVSFISPYRADRDAARALHLLFQTRRARRTHPPLCAAGHAAISTPSFTMRDASDARAGARAGW